MSKRQRFSFLNCLNKKEKLDDDVIIEMVFLEKAPVNIIVVADLITIDIKQE